MSFNVAELFCSINGEGLRAGELAVFVRLAGCNLSCGYCDTAWANEPGVLAKSMTAQEIAGAVLNFGVKNVTLTGGEPLLADGIGGLFELLGEKGLSAEVETNGSVSIARYEDLRFRPRFTLDYKLPGSGMERFMLTDNYRWLRQGDTVKFVCQSKEDLKRAKDVIDEFDLTHKCAVYLSPVFGRIEPSDMVDFMKENRMNDVRLQLQLHKYIWDPMERGV